MATSITTTPWTLLASHEIWNYGGKCSMHFQVFAYCTQDPINNRSTVYTRSRIAIVNNNPYYSGYSVTQTWKVGMTGAANYSWHGTIADAGAGKTSEKILSNGSFTVDHDSSGNATSAVYYWFNGDYTGAIASSAAPTGVQITLPKIDRTAGTPTISNVSSTYNSASCNIKVPFASTVNQYSRDGSNWTNWNKSVSANTAFSDTWSGLSPNTTYTFYYRFRRDYNQVWSPTVSFTVTTAKPSAGNASNNISINVSSLTYNSVTLSFSGGSAGAGGSISYYRLNFNGQGYKRVSNPVTFNGLSPNTTYNFSVDFVDNYGTVASGSTTGSITTKKPSSGSAGTVSVSGIQAFQATVSWDGFKAGAGGSLSRYEYSVNDGSWTSNGTSKSKTITGLSAYTSYTVRIRLVDNYGTASSEASVSFRTLGMSPVSIDNTSPKTSVGFTVRTNRYSTAFTHTIWYRIETDWVWHTVASNVAETCTCTLPDSIFDTKPSSTSLIGDIICRTHDSSGNQVGNDVYARFTVYANSSTMSPSISEVSWVEKNNNVSSITGNWLRYLSNLDISFLGTAKNGSSITTYKVKHSGVWYEKSQSGKSTFNFNGAVIDSSFTVLVRDSRGFETSKTISNTFEQYDYPVITRAEAIRSLETSDYGKIYVEGNYSRVIGNLIKSISITSYSSVSVTNNNGYYSASVDFVNVPYTSGYVWKVTVTDAFNQARSQDIVLSAGKPSFSILKNGIEVNGGIVLNGISLIDSIYPIGSMMLAYNEIDLNDLMKGTSWEQTYNSTIGAYCYRRIG